MYDDLIPLLMHRFMIANGWDRARAERYAISKLKSLNIEKESDALVLRGLQWELRQFTRRNIPLGDYESLAKAYGSYGLKQRKVESALDYCIRVGFRRFPAWKMKSGTGPMPPGNPKRSLTDTQEMAIRSMVEPDQKGEPPKPLREACYIIAGYDVRRADQMRAAYLRRAKKRRN